MKEAKADIKRVLLMNKPEWIYIFIGCLASIATGAVQPGFAVILSKVLALFGNCDHDEQKRQVILYCLIFVGFGVVTLLSNFFQVCYISICISAFNKIMDFTRIFILN